MVVGDAAAATTTLCADFVLLLLIQLGNRQL